MQKPPARAFTLVELLVVIGIIAVLVAILLPTLAGARHQAAAVDCEGKIRQICLALTTYATDYRGSFPTNMSTPSPSCYWYDSDRAGRVLRGSDSPPTTDVRGRSVTCPEDAGAQRSYAMNAWASSGVDTQVTNSGQGKTWKQNIHNADRLILVVETWSSTGSDANGWVAPPFVGVRGTSPGRRFGAGGGLSPQMNAGRFGYVNCELAFYRHRTRGTDAAPTQAVGRVNIGYADGHVAPKTERDLADPVTGLSTLDSLWSPIDADLNK
ncbi:MAG: type II secretion system protein [Tepidisphaerales bacterium]